jgi:hypothetical protein
MNGRFAKRHSEDAILMRRTPAAWQAPETAAVAQLRNESPWTGPVHAPRGPVIGASE